MILKNRKRQITKITTILEMDHVYLHRGLGAWRTEGGEAIVLKKI